MSDIQYNRNPFSGGLQAATPGTTSASPAPSLPQYVDYNQQALAAARAPATPAGTPGYTDYNSLALELSQGFSEQRQANLEAFSYMTPVSDIEYGIIRNRLLQVKDSGGDFQAEAYKLATAVEMSRFFGRSVEDTMENFEPSFKAWMGRDFQPTKTNFLAITDSFRTGSLNVELGKTARAWMDGGGTDAALEKKLGDLSAQLGKLQDSQPRPWIIKALEAGAESAPFTIRAAAAGLAGSALVGLTGGAAAPAALGILKAGASMLGSFAESSDTMRGLEYYDMRQQGIAHETAMPAANMSGALQGAVESLLGNVPGLATMGGAGASIAAKAATKLAVSGAWGSVARSAIQYGGEMIEEGVEEGVQQIISDVIQNSAKADYGIELKDAKDIAKSAWESAKGGFMASVVMGLPASVVGGIRDTKEAKALKEYAGTTDRQTFVENASKWSAVESLSDEQKNKTLNTIWESVQKKAKETRQEAKPEEAKPFKRTESGTLYTEETVVSSAEEGKVEAILKVGDADTKERLGYLKYEVTDEGIVIESSKFEPGYKGIREEAIMELAAKYPDLPITVSEGAPESTQEAFKLLTNAGIVGADKDTRLNAEDQAAKNRLRMVVANSTPNMPASQIGGVVAMHQLYARANGQTLSEYMQSAYSPEVAEFNPGRLKEAYDNATALGQAAPGGRALGATSFDKDGKALVILGEHATFATWSEEAAHTFRRTLSGTERIKPLESYYKVSGGVWSVAQEEQFAADSLQYLAYNTVPDESLRPVFRMISDWIKNIWKALQTGPVSPELKKIMDELYASESSPLSDNTVIAEEQDTQSDAVATPPDQTEEVLFQQAANSTLSTSSSLEKAQASIEKYLYDKPGDIELVPVTENLWAVKKVKSGKVLASFRVKLDKGRYRFEDGDFGMKLPEAKPIKYEGKQAVLFQTESDPLTPGQREFYKDSKIVNPDGTPKDLYSGHGNVALYGPKYDPKKGTSGGFYATDDPGLASRYAMGKFGSRENYENGSQYRVAGKNGQFNKKLWQVEITPEIKAKIDAAVAMRDERDEPVHPIADMAWYIGENKKYDQQVRKWSYRGIYDLQNIYEYYEAMGDTIYQSLDSNATDDEKLSNQNSFEDLLDAIGLQWNSYQKQQPGVMKLHMNITNPIYTNNPFPSDLLEALDKVAKVERKMNDEYWTKNLSMKIWVQSIKDDDGNHHWATQIPSKAMPIIEQFGYDGIVDTSGKGGGEKHEVVIAFYPEQIKTAYNRTPTVDPRMLFQTDDATINAEAEKFDTWEAWRDEVESSADFLGDQSSQPEDMSPEERDQWYKGRWEWVHAEKEKKAAEQRVVERKEAVKGDFTRKMEAEGGVESLLKEIWDAEVAAFDTTQASDEEESQAQDKAYEWKKELATRLGSHSLVELTAQSVGKGKDLKPSTRKAILTYIRNNEVEFASLYAELTGDLDLAQYAESSRQELQSIPNPKLEKFADMSIAERTALLNAISDKAVRARIKSGDYNDPYLDDYVRRLEAEKKELTKATGDAAKEIEELGGKLETESDFALKMYDRSKATAKELQGKEKELDKVQAAKERIETAKASYAEALGSARDESKLSVKIAKKELLFALTEARKEAAFQSRFVAAEIRATAKLKAQRDANRRAILKKPAKNIIYEKRQQIITIQEYLRSKKWEYIEELDDTGKISRKRAYDTVVDADGTKRKVPRYTTVQAENLKAAMSAMLKETPGLLKILTNETVDRINEKPVSAWTLAELQDLRSIIDRIAKEGREAYELKKMMEAREHADARYTIENTTRQNKNYKHPTAHGSDEEKAQRKSMEKFGAWDLPVSKMRYVSPILDGGTEGINTQVLVEEEYEARRSKQNNKARRLGSVYSVIKEYNLKPKDRSRKITIQGVGPDGADMTMSAAKLSHVAIMLMNKSTREHVLYGNLSSEEEHRMGKEYVKANGDAKYPKLLKAIEENLTTGEKVLIDQILKVLNNNEDYNRMNTAVIDLTNEEMGPKEMNYSPAFVEGAILETQKDSIIEAMKAEHGFTVNPESGFTIKRIKIAPDHQVPVKIMDILEMVETSVDTQEHLIAYGKYVKKLNGVYKHPQLSRLTREGIIQTFGTDMVKYIDEYIGAVARGEGGSTVEPGSKALKKLRGYQAVGFLAYRWTSVVKQLITSPLPYMAYAPKETLAAAFQAWGSGNVKKFIDEVESKSAMLQSRTIDQIFEAIKSMDTEGWEGLVKQVGTVGMKGLEYADRISVAIGWKGVYDKELAGGATEEEAIRKADDITFQTQPSSNPADLAPIYRDMTEWKKVLLMFTSSLNTVYNNIAHGVPKAIREKEYMEAVGIVASYAVAGVLLGAFAKSLGKDPPPDDPDEWWRQWMFYSTTQFTDSVPLFGSELSGVMKRFVTGQKSTTFGEDTLPVVSAFAKGVNSLTSGELMKAAEAFSEGVGLAIGLPTLAIKNGIKGIGSVIDGDDEQ